MDPIDTKYRRLREILKETGGVAVAFSGGVDSTLLVCVAKEVLGDRVLALTALSETTPAAEREQAGTFCRNLDIAQVTVETDEIGLAAFSQNGFDRCYHCKKHRFQKLLTLAGLHGFDRMVDGGNRDDSRDYRPGLRAVSELGIASPLNQAGMTKAEVRELSRRLGLPTWNKPADACLATRIPYGIPITAEKLGQVAHAEEAVRSLGITGHVRVRHHGDIARVEVPDGEISRFAEDAVRSEIVRSLRALGFDFVTLDLEGYCMGSLNRQIPATAPADENCGTAEMP